MRRFLPHLYAALAVVALTVTLSVAQGIALYVGTGDFRATEIGADGTPYLRVAPGGAITTLNGATLASTGISASSADVAFDAGNYTASDAQTWTVDEADQQFLNYACVGKLCTVGFSLFTTSVSGTAATLSLALPAAITPAQTTNGAITGRNAGTLVHTRAFVVAESPVLSFQQVDGASWGAATNTTTLRGQIVFMIQ